MHAAETQPALARIEAQLDQLESAIPSLRLQTLELEAWVEFLERGRRLDG